MTLGKKIPQKSPPNCSISFYFKMYVSFFPRHQGWSRQEGQDQKGKAVQVRRILASQSCLTAVSVYVQMRKNLCKLLLGTWKKKKQEILNIQLLVLLLTVFSFNVYFTAALRKCETVLCENLLYEPYPKSEIKTLQLCRCLVCF